MRQLPPGWYVDDLRASSGWLVWVEKSASQYSNPMHPVAWREYAHSFAENQTWLLRKSRKSTPAPPGVSLTAHTLLTSYYQGLMKRTSNIWQTNLLTRRAHVVARNVHDSGFEVAEHGMVIGLISNSRSIANARTDLWFYKDGNRTRLTHTGDVGTHRFADGHLVWTRTTPRHVDTVFIRSFPDGRAVKLFSQSDASLSPGNGFIGDYENGTGYPLPVAISTRATGIKPLVLPEPRGMAMVQPPAVAGDLEAWLVAPGSDLGRHQEFELMRITK